MTPGKTYCLDTNILVEAWNKYYSPDLCPEYWEIIDELARRGSAKVLAELLLHATVDVEVVRMIIVDRAVDFSHPREHARHRRRRRLLCRHCLVRVIPPRITVA